MDLFASEYGWTIEDMDEATPAQMQELFAVIMARRKAEHERKAWTYIPLDKQDQAFDVTEIDGKACVKVFREQLAKYRMDELAGQIITAILAAGFNRPKNMKNIIPDPPWQSVIDKHKLNHAREKAEERGLKVPEVR